MGSETSRHNSLSINRCNGEIAIPQILTLLGFLEIPLLLSMFVTVLKKRNIPSLFVSGCVTINLSSSITQKLPFDGKTGLVTITNSAPADSSPYILLELSLKINVRAFHVFNCFFVIEMVPWKKIV